MYYPTSGAEYDATEKVYCGLEKLCKLAKGEDKSMGDGMVFFLELAEHMKLNELNPRVQNS